MVGEERGISKVVLELLLLSAKEVGWGWRGWLLVAQGTTLGANLAADVGKKSKQLFVPTADIHLARTQRSGKQATSSRDRGGSERGLDAGPGVRLARPLRRSNAPSYLRLCKCASSTASDKTLEERSQMCERNKKKVAVTQQKLEVLRNGDATQRDAAQRKPKGKTGRRGSFWQEQRIGRVEKLGEGPGRVLQKPGGGLRVGRARLKWSMVSFLGEPFRLFASPKGSRFGWWRKCAGTPLDGINGSSRSAQRV